jgi:hypothetical protein
MTKEEVRKIVGEPARKNDIGIQWWVYPDADRTVVFREDTVYSIITSAEARLDSIKSNLKKAGEDIDSGFKKLGRNIDSSAKKVKNNLDTLKNKKK